MDQDNYWLRRARAGRVSRRRFVGGAAAGGLGAAAIGLVGCGDDDDDTTATSAPASATTGGGSPTGTASATGTATQGGGAPQKGGVYRTTSANNTWDTFDIDRSRFSPVAWVYGFTNNGIVQWKSYANAELEGGLASKWQQPDNTTLVLTLRDNVFWHNKAPVNGRAATADDIAKFIQRNKDSKLRDGTVDTNFYRAATYAKVDKVEVTDAKTVKVTFSKPDPFFLGTLGGSYAKVMAPEAIDTYEADFSKLNADHVIGTGGFVLKQWAAEGNSKWDRFDKSWRDTWLDGVEWFPLFTDQAAQQAGFEQKQLDSFAPTNPEVGTDIKKRFSGKVKEVKYFAANPQAGTYAAQTEPWSDPRKIGAIFRAFDRRSVLNSLIKGQGSLSGNIPPPQQAYAIPEKELITLPGYKEDRAAEEAEAKQMWEAGGGPALGEIVVDIPDIWEGLYSGGAALITTQLKKVLGNDFTAKIETYTTISTKVTKAEYGNGNKNIWWGWISDLLDPEPTLTNFLIYNSTSPQWAQFGYKSDKIDKLTSDAVAEFDINKRKDMNKEIDRELIKASGAGIHYTLCQIVPVLFWNYVQYSELASFVTQHQVANAWWFDQKDPTFQGRPA